MRKPDKIQKLEAKGFTWLRQALTPKTLSTIQDSITWEKASGSRIITLPHSLINRLEELIHPYLPNGKLSRLTAFDKSIENNWSLPWHQDRVIVSKTRNDDPRFINWSNKGAYWHCEPPIEFLQSMIFARIYLDDANADKGDLQLAQGSHKFGKVPSTDINKTLAKCRIINCSGQKGDVLLAKALILHRSHSSHSTATRRILRVDFSTHQAF